MSTPAAADLTAASSGAPARGARFRYEGFEIVEAADTLVCRYSLDGRPFVERVAFPGATGWGRPEVAAAARLVYLLAAVSYYKTGAPPVVDLGETAVTDREREFLRTFYVEGLGEFAYRNGIDLRDLVIEGPRLDAPLRAAYSPAPGRPLVPFGGGIDSIVTVELLKPRFPAAALFVMNRPGDRFDAIERPAEVTGLPVLRAEREIDPDVLRSRELGFLNGHVPVTGVLSAVAVMCAVLDGRDAVVMSNEWSASVPTLEFDGRAVNHQWSKSAEFEQAFQDVLADALGPSFAYFSALRAYSELWIARRFAELTGYHSTFRSCNRAFAIDRSRRWETWCGECDKCCFIDLILAPFLPTAALEDVFGGREPLADESLAERFRTLVATSPDAKPWECVGDIGESRAALLLAAERPDRSTTPLLQALAAEVAVLPDRPDTATLLQPLGSGLAPATYAL
ncbi:endonuclease domain-containing protein [Motilibacter deserti]|uniref:UDP-N-acetyl-alpha-D-muramoyl-L-alanyl-L-glutamate epimerase n=1 Tax=Motilibacter deserti TaxID=2714956 RepID=A0ABX0GVV1_9ACTN|nr:endonuclease domain-containing protein [Motilibacter deserti]NHC13831.1 endonuclease domain-containing protein [Motilibacter deserti]